MIRPLLLLALIGLVACAPPKERAGADANANGAQVGAPTEWEWNWRGLRSLIRMYPKLDEGANREQLRAIWRDFGKSILLPKGLPRTPEFQELWGTALAFDANGDGKVAASELSDEAIETSPVLKWLPAGSPGRSCGELNDILWREASLASTASINGLARALCWLDSSSFGGDGDGLISRVELGSAGWFNHAWKASWKLNAALKEGKGQPAPRDMSPIWSWPWPNEPRVAAWLERLLAQSSFRVGARSDSSSSREADRRMEWLTLALRGQLARRATHAGTPTVGVSQAQLSEALDLIGVPHESVGREARVWYDRSWASGDGNGDITWTEAFYLFLDAEFMAKMTGPRVTGGDFRLDHWDEINNRDSYWQAIFRAVPFVREAWGLDSGNVDAPRRRLILQEFWTAFQSFDRQNRRGNGNGRLEVGEALLAWNALRLVDKWLAKYDVDHSGLLEPAEAEAFTRALSRNHPEMLTNNPFTESEPVEDVLGWFRYVTGTSKVVPTSISTVDLYVWLTQVLPSVR